MKRQAVDVVVAIEVVVDAGGDRADSAKWGETRSER